MGLAIALVACARSAPEPDHQPTLEAVVVELKDVPPPETPKLEPPPPPPVVPETPKQSRKVTKSKPTSHVATKPPQPETKPSEPKPDPTPPKPDNKPPLETNPYIYK